MVADFEAGTIPREFNFFVANDYNVGQYTWEVAEGGANGTSKALKLTVQSGAPYFYFDPSAHGGTPRWLVPNKNANRLGFWLKLPKNWGADMHPSDIYNFHVGWYLSNDRYSNETNNGHFYHQMFLVPDGEWFYVKVGTDYSWQRDRGTPTFDPAHTLHLTDFDDFFSKVTRFCLACSPAPGSGTYAPTPYEMWVDEIELFYEEDAITTSPSIVRAAPGESKEVEVTNHTDETRSYDVRVTALSGTGATVTDGEGLVTSLTLGPGETKRIRAAPTRATISNVVIYPKGGPQSGIVRNQTSNSRYRGSYMQPSAGILVVGR